MHELTVDTRPFSLWKGLGTRHQIEVKGAITTSLEISSQELYRQEIFE